MEKHLSSVCFVLLVQTTFRFAFNFKARFEWGESNFSVSGPVHFLVLFTSSSPFSNCSSVISKLLKKNAKILKKLIQGGFGLNLTFKIQACTQSQKTKGLLIPGQNSCNTAKRVVQVLHHGDLPTPWWRLNSRIYVWFNVRRRATI